MDRFGLSRLQEVKTSGVEGLWEGHLDEEVSSRTQAFQRELRGKSLEVKDEVQNDGETEE